MNSTERGPQMKNWLDAGISEAAAALYETNKQFMDSEKTLGTAGKEQVYAVIGNLKSALFPGVYEENPIDEKNVDLFIGLKLREAAIQLTELIERVLYHACRREKNLQCNKCRTKAEHITSTLIAKLPEVREYLAEDIQAAYDGDPAVRYREEILLSYPYIEAITIHRIAHILYQKDVPVIPRIMSEYAHEKTGIDIHPGAKIGKRFFIDHGTGVVIGETCTIGNNVKMYQGVTLGARSFDLDENGNPVKGIKRHPDIEDDVIIYSGASILGGDTRIGHGSIIGGNVWLTHSVPPFSKVYNAQPSPIIKHEGGHPRAKSTAL